MNSSHIPLIILAGGFGTRLRSMVSDVPKPLADIQGKPFLFHLVYSLYRQGTRNIVLSLFHQASLIEEFLNSTFWPEDLKITAITEPEPLGTGGAVKYAAERLDLQRSVYVCNGDTLLPGGLAQFSAKIERNQNSVALIQVDDISRYGAVSLGTNQVIEGFCEKTNEVKPGLINSGLYSIQVEELRGKGKVFSMEKDFFPEQIQKGNLIGVEVKAPFIDIGVPKDYAFLCSEFNSRKWSIN